MMKEPASDFRLRTESKKASSHKFSLFCARTSTSACLSRCLVDTSEVPRFGEACASSSQRCATNDFLCAFAVGRAVRRVAKVRIELLMPCWLA